PRSYRPRLEVLEDRLPPGDTVLAALLVGSWAAPVPLDLTASPEGSGYLAPQGRLSVARGVSPWEAVEQSLDEPWRGGRAVVRSELLSPFQGSGEQGLSDPQGWRPGLAPLAPLGLANELTDGTVSNTSPSPRQPGGEVRGTADPHAGYRPADAGN